MGLKNFEIEAKFTIKLVMQKNYFLSLGGVNCQLLLSVMR